MEKMVRCKACGFVTRESDVRDVCPACGLPRTVFEEHDEKISKKRKLILELHLHPIAVHFPQALAALVFVFLAGGLLLDSRLGGQLTQSAWILAVLLFPAVLGAILAGVVDGKIRFKKLATPFLRQKMVLGFLLLVLSTPMAATAIWCQDQSWAPYLLLGLSLGCLACEVFLGKIGVKLMYARLNG